MNLKKRIAKLFSRKKTTKESLQFFKPGDHVSYQINSPDAVGNEINKIKFYYVDETGLLVYRENIPSLLAVSFITYNHQTCLFAFAVSENDIPFTIEITVNGKPYQSQKFSEQIITII
jgi:hypothetical protein